MLKRKRQKLPSESEFLRHFQNDPRFMVPPSNFIEGMIIDPPAISVPIKEEPETSPNSYGGLYSIPSTSVLCQPTLTYGSRTPSPLEYQFPTTVVPNQFYGQPPLPKPPNIRTSSGSSMSGCIATEVVPPLPSQNTASCQITSGAPTALDISSLPCPAEGNESSLMEGAFSSLDRLDSSDLREFTMLEDSEQVLSANLSASLQLAENSIPEKASNEKDVQENINMQDSFDRIANNTLEEFCEIYTKPN